MPTMVMSQPPKASGGSNSVRKRQKNNKSDNILAVKTQYVGQQGKFDIFVRERLVYRSNVEVTYEDVYNYLNNYTNDDTISLHYSVNGSYVSITTTGQLHTFLRHVHNDPEAILYVENQEFVWNMNSLSKSSTMEKRVPVDAQDPPYDSAEDEEEELSQDEEGGDGCQVTEEEVSDEGESGEDEEEEEAEEVDEKESRVPPILTSNAAQIVYAKKIPVNEAFVAPPCMVVKPIGKKSSKKVEGPNKEPYEFKEDWTATSAYNELQDMLTDTLNRGDLGVLPQKLAEMLVPAVWNPAFPKDEKAAREAVQLLEASLGAGMVHYHRKVRDRFAPENMENAKNGSGQTPILSQFKPNHDPELLAEFIDTAIISACDKVECAQHLAKLQEEIEWFNKLREAHGEGLIVPDQFPGSFCPTLADITDHVNSIIIAAHFGIKILDPSFHGECTCKESIQLLQGELQKVHSALQTAQETVCTPDQIHETKDFVIDSADTIIKRFTDKECPNHRSILHALIDSENHLWRSNPPPVNEPWAALKENGENLYNVPLESFGMKLERPTPYAMKPENTAGDPNVVPIAHNLGDLNSTSNVLNIPTHVVQNTPEPVNNSSGQDVAGGAPTAPNVLVQATAAADGTAPEQAATTQATAGQTAGGAPVVVQKKMSDRLQQMVDAMMKKSPPPHNYVYPPPPKPGAILIPIGGLAHCRCSKNCPEFLMEPAYEYVERFNEPRQTVWEKTKQKRHKKN